MGCIQKVQMWKCTPRHLFFFTHKCMYLIKKAINAQNIMKVILTSTAKVCMTAKRKTTYCHEIWTHITLARCYVN